QRALPAHQGIRARLGARQCLDVEDGIVAEVGVAEGNDLADARCVEARLEHRVVSLEETADLDRRQSAFYDQAYISGVLVLVQVDIPADGDGGITANVNRGVHTSLAAGVQVVAGAGDVQRAAGDHVAAAGVALVSQAQVI